MDQINFEQHQRDVALLRSIVDVFDSTAHASEDELQVDWYGLRTGLIRQAREAAERASVCSQRLNDEHRMAARSCGGRNERS